MDPEDSKLKEWAVKEVEDFKGRHPGLIDADIEKMLIEAHPNLPAGNMTPTEYLEALLMRILH